MRPAFAADLRMKILFTRFPLESALGGAEIQTLSLMTELQKRGHTVAFLGSCPTLLAECRKRGFPVTVLEIGPPPVTTLGTLSFAWRAPGMRRTLEKALSAFTDLDAVVMLSLSEKLLATAWCATHGVRAVWVEHDRVGPWLTRNPWLARLRALSRTAVTVVVSHLSAEVYRGLGWRAEDIATIPNGIDLHRFDGTARAERTDPSENLQVGCVARLSPEKGVDVLVRAMESVPDARLDIVGEGRSEAMLRGLIADKGLVSRVAIRPRTEDLGAFYRDLDAFVLPSREHDPFGLVAAEAMSLGVPTVVTDACGIAGELRDGQDALVVPADDADALAGALTRLRDSTLRRLLSQNGRKTAAERFSLAAMADRYEAVLGGH
jgi:glycosyltransferase involved in cell wall biosynthesis